MWTPPVRRVETARGHHYTDSAGVRIPGVTTILGDGIPKPALINWAANATAGAAIDRWDELSDLPPSERLKVLQKARYDKTDKAKKRGTEVHGYAEKLAQGEAVSGVPDALRGHVENYAAWLDHYDVQPILVETVIVSWKYGYAGTLDLVADITCPTCERGAGGICRWLLDVKTNETGIFPETALQLAAYRYSDSYVDDDGAEQQMLEVAHTGAVLVNASFAHLVPTESGPDQLTTFRFAQKIRAFVKDGRALVGAPIDADLTGRSSATINWENV